MNHLRVAAIQYPMAEELRPSTFFEKVASFVAEAKANQAQLVVFPELITCELVNWQDEDTQVSQLRSIAQEFTPRYVEFVADLARREKIAILAGTTPRVNQNDIVNSAVLAFEDGQVNLQDKIFLTQDEKNWGWTPGRSINVISTPWGRSVIQICFDCEFPGISSLLACHTPEVILVPSWTSTMAGFNRVEWTAKARAIEHYAFVIKAATVQAANSTQPHFGRAGIYSPQDGAFGTEPIEGTLNERQIIYGDLDLGDLRAKRVRSDYYPSKEQLKRKSPIEIESSIRISNEL